MGFQQPHARRHCCVLERQIGSVPVNCCDVMNKKITRRVMLGFCVLFLFVFFRSSAHSDPLQPVRNQNLASILQTLDELTNNFRGPGPYQVRIFDVPEFIGECGGTIQSCPNVALYIVVAEDGLGNPATLYELPLAKGWKFSGWIKEKRLSNGDVLMGFKIETTIPDANIEANEWKSWKPTVYQVWISPDFAEYKALN